MRNQLTITLIPFIKYFANILFYFILFCFFKNSFEEVRKKEGKKF